MPASSDAIASSGLFVLSAFIMLISNKNFKKIKWNKSNNNKKKDSPVPGEGISSLVLSKIYEINTGMGLLTVQEVEFAVQVAKLRHKERVLQFIEVNFIEPTKQQYADHFAVYKSALPRQVQVISMDISKNQTLLDNVIFYGDNSLNDMQENIKNKDATQVLQDVQAGISPDEYVFVEQLTKAYKPLRDAIAKRGLDPEGIAVDAWCCGHTGPDCDPIERICWPSMFYRDPAVDDLIYARPIEGIDIRISLTKKEVIRFSDTGFGTLPIPASNESFLQNYVPVEHQRKDLKPIIITQPEGPSWAVTNRNVVDWQGWKFQVGFNSREGLTLHGITYANRPILHRMSICEMVVPYGDPRSPHCLKNAFDAGEDGLGRNANSLVLGCDCLGVIKYFDANLVRDNGDVFIIKNAICMHEEDHGLGWKHTDWRTSIPYSTRSRRLALSFVCTIANYEYGFFFYFYLDGTIETEVKLTGILSTGSLSYEEYQAGGRKYGINLGGHLYAPVHQHLFLCKMDFVIDGTDNRVVEYNVEADSKGPHNPSGNGFYYTETLFDTELGTDCCPETARFWKIQSGSKYNKIGGRTGYKLVPSMKVGPFVKIEEALHLKRAQFLEHQLWVTPYDKDQKYPAGTFVNQNPKLDGLPVWTKKYQRNIVDTDIVVWHMFGVTHLPRPEDWPIMPVEYCGFHIKPAGFLEHSFVMDVPQSNVDVNKSVCHC